MAVPIKAHLRDEKEKILQTLRKQIENQQQDQNLIKTLL